MTAANVTPDRCYADRVDTSARPSWRANPGYVDEGHRRVFAETKDIPGWQAVEDTYKLYEMAYFAGDVILELGVYGGRSSVVQLKGALSNPRRAHRPQFFGLDLDPAAMKRSYDSLAAAEWEASGDATFCGAFGCAALFVTTLRCRGNAVPRMDDESFERRRLSLLRSHGVLPAAPEPENGADNRRPRLRDLVSTARNWALRRR